MSARRTVSGTSAASVGAAGAVVTAAAVLFVAAPGKVWASSSGTRHFACSKANSAKMVCRFSTPSGNIRCEWMPSPNSVACVLVATRRAYRLRPTGKAKAIHLALQSRGETLPTYQQIVFPNSLSCRDTKTTMTCNQDFGTGFFKLSPRSSRSG
ncbi:MAG TPA: hypothetical protein VGX51_07275 [Solirubrobacteraceae bacterium]|nr:hypothetical protein [Solirubrobacteraceae bacterium]